MNRQMIATAALMAAGLLMTGAAHAQTLNDPAQLQREHMRAVAAHDPANDPYNPRSSNLLNRMQLKRALSLGDEPGVAQDNYRMPSTKVSAMIVKMYVR